MPNVPVTSPGLTSLHLRVLAIAIAMGLVGERLLWLLYGGQVTGPRFTGLPSSVLFSFVSAVAWLLLWRRLRRSSSWHGAVLIGAASSVVGAMLMVAILLFVDLLHPGRHADSGLSALEVAVMSLLTYPFAIPALAVMGTLLFLPVSLPVGAATGLLIWWAIRERSSQPGGHD